MERHSRRLDGHSRRMDFHLRRADGHSRRMDDHLRRMYGNLRGIVGILRDTRDFANVEWEITNFSELENASFIYGTEFLLSDVFFKIYLEQRDAVIDFILIKDIFRPMKTENHRVRFTFGIKTRDGSVYQSSGDEYEFFNEIYASSYTKLDFIERSQLLEMRDVLLPNDTLRIFCVARLVDGNILETATQTVPPDGSKILVEKLTELYRKENSDVKIIVEGKEFQAHRSILSARSPVFASILFDKDMIEKKPGDVVIADCDSNSFEDFLLYLYTGQMGKVSCGKVFDIYRTAEKFDLKELCTKCAQCMACDLSVDSFCDAFLIAVRYNESELLERVKEFFIKNVKAILLTTKWQLFMKNHHTVANELIIKAANKN